MATIMDMLNQGLGGLNTPLGQLGTSLLGQSGPQQGNPSGGARLGQAFANMSEMQRAQALQHYRNQQIQLGEQQQAMALAQQKAKTEQQHVCSKRCKIRTSSPASARWPNRWPSLGLIHPT